MKKHDLVRFRTVPGGLRKAWSGVLAVVGPYPGPVPSVLVKNERGEHMAAMVHTLVPWRSSWTV